MFKCALQQTWPHTLPRETRPWKNGGDNGEEAGRGGEEKKSTDGNWKKRRAEDAKSQGEVEVELLSIPKQPPPLQTPPEGQISTQEWVGGTAVNSYYDTVAKTSDCIKLLLCKTRSSAHLCLSLCLWLCFCLSLLLLSWQSQSRDTLWTEGSRPEASIITGTERYFWVSAVKKNARIRCEKKKKKTCDVMDGPWQWWCS